METLLTEKLQLYKKMNIFGSYYVVPIWELNEAKMKFPTSTEKVKNAIIDDCFKYDPNFLNEEFLKLVDRLNRAYVKARDSKARSTAIILFGIENYKLLEKFEVSKTLINADWVPKGMRSDLNKGVNVGPYVEITKKFL